MNNHYQLSKKLAKKISTLFLLLFLPLSYAVDVPIYDFPINAYTQNINDYLPSNSPDYETPLLKPEYQASQLKQFYNHYYGSLSPWNEQMVKAVLPLVKKMELAKLEDFNNQKQASSEHHYAENFKEHDEGWLNQIRQNMNLSVLDSNKFNEKNRAIAINNTLARTLPEGAPDFFYFSLPGQGFPFDNLQESAIWVGTPLYVIAVSQNKAWSLVLTPDAYFAWVKSSDIAYSSNKFVKQWRVAAQKGLVAITKTDTTVVNQRQAFQFTGYIGAVFPSAQRNENPTSILIPTKNTSQQAVITVGIVNQGAASLMPLPASKKNMKQLLEQLQNRPYGWGGVFFLNDCSQELKSVMTPFSIWLARNTKQQEKQSEGLDLSTNKVDTRLQLLQEKGHPLMTGIYVNGHVMLYVGNKARGDNHTEEAITYQNVWGLPSMNGDKRYIIGQSVFFPLLEIYPENPDAKSSANKPYFKLMFLDELETETASPQAFVKHFIDTSS